MKSSLSRLTAAGISAGVLIAVLLPALGEPNTPPESPTPPAPAAPASSVSATPTPSATSTRTPVPVSSPTATISPSATPTPSPTPTPTLTAPPIHPPPDAPRLRVTTPPYVIPSFGPSPSVPENLWLSEGDTITVPIEVHAHRAFVPVVLNGRASLFLLDTGTPTTTIDVDALGNNRPDTAYVVQIGELRLPRVRTMRSGLRQSTELFIGTPADGVLGQDLFARYPIGIDFRNRTITIYHDAQAAAATRQPQMMVVPLTVSGDMPAVQTSVNDRSFGLFGFNTGMGTDISMSQSAWQASRQKGEGSVSELRQAAPVNEGPGLTMRVRNLAIGPLHVEHPLMSVRTPGSSRFDASPLAGIVGAGLLEKTAVIVDEPGQNLVLIPYENPPPSVYDHSGVWLVWRRGTAVIHSILQGSPAEESRLKVGDALLALNGTAIASLDFVRQAFESASGTRWNVTYKRGRSIHQTTLTLRVLL